MSRKISYSKALLEAQDYLLKTYKEVYVMGLGVPDPKGIFGTTLGLQEKYGSERVFDIPLSENAMTGVALGSAISGMRPILTHQRVDFALVAMEQMVNQAAKWHFMFGGKMKAPMVIRMIIGRGWGQGPQHSQVLHNWFAHIPGLKVVMPVSPRDAKGMLISAVNDENPVIFLEHRWLYDLEDYVEESSFSVELDTCNLLRKGKDITLIGVSYSVVDCLEADKTLREIGINSDVIDLKSIRPLDMKTIISSVKKTGNVIIVDSGHVFSGISAEISASIYEELHGVLKKPPKRIGLPDYPTPTSTSLSDGYYPVKGDIIRATFEILDIKDKIFENENLNRRLDQPNKFFEGPF